LLVKDKATETVLLNGPETEPATLHAEVSTIPMFSNQRLIVIKHADLALKKILSSDEIFEYFKRDFPNLPESTYCIIQIEEAKLAKKLEFLNELSVIIKEPKIKEENLAQYLLEKVTHLEFESDLTAMNFLCEKSNFNQRDAIIALDRVFTYCLDTKRITQEDIKSVCFDLDGDLFFTISNDIASRKIQSAIKQFERHKLKDASPILGNWSKLFSDALRSTMLKKCQLKDSEIKSRLSISWWQQKNIDSITKNYSLVEIKNTVLGFIELDKKIKEHPNPEMQKTLMHLFLTKLIR